MPRFRFFRDALFLAGCAAYALNRWWIAPRAGPGFMMFHFNDLWLIPCALPPVLWIQSRLGLRAPHDPPSVTEIAGHLIVWSVLFEWIGPRFLPHAQGDPMDVAAYAAGALVAGLWWQRHRLLTKLKLTPLRP